MRTWVRIAVPALLAAAGSLLTAGPGEGTALLDAAPARNTAAADHDRWTRAALLGYLAKSDGSGIVPVLGVPGAAVFGPAVKLPDTATRVHLPPGQAYALVELNSPEGESIVVVELAGANAGPAASVEGVSGAPEGVRFSPTGGCAALSWPDSQEVVLVANLPYAPAFARKIRVPLNGDGETCDMAISDDCTAVAIRPDGILELLSTDGPQRTLYRSDALPAAAFVPGSADLLVFDAARGSLHTVRRASTGGAAHLVAAGLDGFTPGEAVLTALDRRTAALGAEGGNVVRIIDLTSGATSEFVLPAPVRSFGRLRGDGVYLLSRGSSGPAFLGLLSGAAARGFRIPALAARGEMEE